MVSETRSGAVLGRSSDYRSEKRDGKRPVGSSSRSITARSPARTSGRRSSNPRPTLAEMRAAFKRLEFKATRYPHEKTMVELGIYEDCQILFNAMGLKRFMEDAYASHDEATFQFLATLSVTFYAYGEETPEEDGDGYIRFKYGSETHRMSFRDLESIFGFSQGDMREMSLNIEKEELESLWGHIGVGTYKPGVTKSTKIRHPALRYVQRAIAHTFFARKECGAVLTKELEIMDDGLVEIIQETRNGTELRGSRRSTGLITILLKELLHYKSWMTSTPSDKPQVGCGGIVTAILRGAGVELEEPTHGIRWIDIPYLKKCQFLGKPYRHGHRYQFTLPSNTAAVLFLPNPYLTTIREPQHLDFEPQDEHLFPYGADFHGDYEEEYRGGANIVAEEDDTEEDGYEDPTDEYGFPLYGAERYHFDPITSGTHRTLKTAHDRINVLQRYCKWQDRSIRKLVSTVKGIKGHVKGLKGQIKSLTSKLKGSTSSPRLQADISPEEPEYEEEGEGSEDTDSHTLQERHSFSFMPRELYQSEPGRSSYHEGSISRKRRASQSPIPESDNPSLSTSEDTTSSPHTED